MDLGTSVTFTAKNRWGTRKRSGTIVWMPERHMSTRELQKELRAFLGKYPKRRVRFNLKTLRVADRRGVVVAVVRGDLTYLYAPLTYVEGRDSASSAA